MELHIPPTSTRRWTGPYLGNYYGNLWKTFNIDLDRNEGHVSLARRMTVVADTSDTNTDTLWITSAFIRTNADCTDQYWALGDSAGLYKVDSSPSGSWAKDVLANSPTDANDMAVFETDSTGDTGRQQLFVTRSADIASLNDTGDRAWVASWWVTGKGQTALKTGVPHPICYFPFRRIMLIGDANRLHTFSRISVTATEAVTASRLVLPTELQIQHIFTTTNRAWILCANISGAGNGKIVEWDGFSETYNAIYDVFSAYPLSGVAFREIPIVVNNKGMILEYTGSGFAPMIRNGQTVAFPFSEEVNLAGIYTPSLIGNPRPKGMIVSEDGLIYIAMAHTVSNSFRHGGGIWCLNPTTGRLYLKHAIGSWVNTSYGEQRTSLGGLYPIPYSASAGGFLVGGFYNNNNVNSDRSAIWILDTFTSTTANRGYFITQFIPSNEVRDFWDSLWVRFNKFITATNRIVVKAKGVRSLRSASFALEVSITWVDATSFTVTLGATDDPLAVGDEVEVINGVNSGTLSHILTIVGNHAAVQTITIDETLTASTNSARARFDRWKKLGVISSTSKYEDNVNVGIDSSFIQFKVEMRGPVSEMEISDLIVNSKPSIVNKK